MSKGVGFRPQLLPPQGRQLERSYRPWRTCVVVGGCMAVLIWVVFGLTAYNIYQHRFGRTRHTLHAGDEASLSRAGKDLMPTFCSAYTVHPLGQVDFLLLPHQAELDPMSRVHFTFNLTTSPHDTLFDTSTHYLPENSSVVLTACRGPYLQGQGRERVFDKSAEILVVVGDEKFKAWHRHFDDHIAWRRVRIPEDALCRDPNATLPRLELTTTQPDTYHFILFVPHTPAPAYPQTVTLVGRVAKSLYNVSTVEGRCNATEESCRFPLAWGSRPDMVVEVPVNRQDSDAAAVFVTRCQERWLLWIPVFGGAPVVLMLLMWLCCWRVLVRGRKIHAWYGQPEVSVPAHPGYGSIRDEAAPLLEEEEGPIMAGNVDGRASIQD